MGLGSPQLSMHVHVCNRQGGGCKGDMPISF